MYDGVTIETKGPFIAERVYRRKRGKIREGMEHDGAQLIFLISQPRSGSTLLQHILGSHSDIHTVPEPWVLLPFVYAMKPDGVTAPYSAQIAHHALDELATRLPFGKDTYDEAVRLAALHVYEAALAESGKRLFLDKTPRYYFIIPELANLFPAARFVFLLRNPLAVLSSLVETTLEGRWSGLYLTDRTHDIFAAPRLILDGIELLGDRCSAIEYEQLVSEPVEVVRTLCRELGIPFEQQMLQYRDRVGFEGSRFVDPKAIYRQSRPVSDYADAWKTAFADPGSAAMARGYLEALGRDTFEAFGYSFDDALGALGGAARCAPWRLLKKPPSDRSWTESVALSALRKAERFRETKREAGLGAALRRALKSLTGGG